MQFDLAQSPRMAGGRRHHGDHDARRGQGCPSISLASGQSFGSDALQTYSHGGPRSLFCRPYRGGASLEMRFTPLGVLWNQKVSLFAAATARIPGSCGEAEVLVRIFDEIHSIGPRTTWQQRISGLVPWLKTLQPPIGLFVVHDYRARLVIEECKNLGLQVPHDVAVLGVDNDPTVCECCRPTLSSVCRNGFLHGYEAARTLDQLMAGKSIDDEPTYIPPVGVVRRRSTDTITVDNPHVTTVIQYMYEHLGEPFGIKRLLRLVPVSRRNLEKQFRRHLHCTPYEYLVWLRVEKAKQLLREKKRLKIGEIAEISGFPNPVQFRTVFKRLTKQNPRQYANIPRDVDESRR